MPRTKSQGNGQGCAYKRGKVWEAQVIVGWRLPDAPGDHPIPVKRRKSGFKTKAEALEDMRAWHRRFRGLALAKRIQFPPILSVSGMAFGGEYTESQG